MKNSMKIALSTLSVAVIMFAIGCSNTGNNPISSNDGTDVLSSIFNHTSTDLSPICTEGQFPNDNGETPYGSPMGDDYKGLNGGGPMGGNHGMKDESKFGQLRKILPCLTLTADQMTQLKSIMQGSRIAAEKIMSDTRTAEQPFRTAADAQVKVIKDAVKAGTMTREDARTAINAIRTQLIADTKPLRDAARAAITDLQNALLAQIRAILTAEQLVIWDAWMTSGIVPCTPPPHGNGHR